MSKELRIFMATQGSRTVGVRLDLSARAAKRFDFTGSSATTRISALEALIAEIKAIDFEGMTQPVQFFINDHMVKSINNGFYKYWLLTGATSDGEAIAEEELALWEEFHSLYCENNLFIVLKSTSEAKISDSLKAMEGKRSRKTGRVIKITVTAKQNDKYSTFCWDTLKKIVGEVDDIDDSMLA